MQRFRLKSGKPAMKVQAIKLATTSKAVLFKCNGKQVWLDKDTVEIVDKKTILVALNIYNQKIK